MFIARVGWRPFFCSGAGQSALALSLVPLDVAPTGYCGVCVSSRRHIPDILRQRSAWGTCGGLFSINYVSYFLLLAALLLGA